MESDLRKKLMQAGDGHYDHEQRPIGCHVCGTSPIRGTRYEIHSVKWSVCRKCAVECGADPDEKVMIFSEKLPGEEKKATAYYVLPAWSDFPGEVETRALMLGVMAERMSAAYDFEWYNVDSNFAGMLQSVRSDQLPHRRPSLHPTLHPPSVPSYPPSVPSHPPSVPSHPPSVPSHPPSLLRLSTGPPASPALPDPERGACAGDQGTHP
eukprot:6401472-Prymnesium_polylepis.1